MVYLGYLQNKPVLFSFTVGGRNIIYENGFQIQGANPKDGACFLNMENDNIVNMNEPFNYLKSILFMLDNKKYYYTKNNIRWYF